MRRLNARYNVRGVALQAGVTSVEIASMPDEDKRDEAAGKDSA